VKIECSSATPWGIHPTLVDHQCPRCGWGVEKPAPKAEPANFFALAARRLRAFALTRRAA
jgi:hypothetical protein